MENKLIHGATLTLSLENIIDEDNKTRGYRVALYNRVDCNHEFSDCFATIQSANRVFDFYARHAFPPIHI